LLDLYGQLQETQLGYETGLDFSRAIQVLTKKRDSKLVEAAGLQKKIEDKNKMTPPNVDWNLEVGTILRLTNNAELKSFNTFVAGGKPSTTLFLKYLKRIAETGKVQQTWLGNWPDIPHWEAPKWEAEHFDLVLKRLREFYDLWAAHLPESSVAQLTAGFAPSNYFVEGWQSLSRDEAINEFTQEKKNADENLQHFQELLVMMPESLEQVAEVRLFLVAQNNPNNRLEVIRFTNSGRRSLP
jgi:hypothetical protein